MTDAERTRDLRRLRFPGKLEQAFQAADYRELAPGLRAGFLLVIALHAALDLLHFAQSGTVDFPGLLIPSACALLIAGSYHPLFAAVWQPVIVAVFCVVGSVGLNMIARVQRAEPLIASIRPPEASELFRTVSLLVNTIWFLILGLVLTRIRFRWFVVGGLGALSSGVTIALFTAHLPPGYVLGANVFAVSLVLGVLAFVSYLQERSARGEFLANHLLARERDQELRKRERTEAMLHVLGQAIGGIVHDLGNPLTAVQTGAQTLELFLEKDSLDEESLREIIPIITDGGTMLDYLRLSLLEQMRVLEGKPVPIERRRTAVRLMAETGVRLQKPKFAAGRTVTFDGPEVEAQVDEMRLATVLMNLIGNALKYSDGEVRVTWRVEAGSLLLAVLDCGVGGGGITREQSAQLFVPFGRLDAHSEVEGTGLGLLSARAVVEAHGGELFILGYADGTPHTASYCTGSNRHPFELTEPFRTAFVAVCPGSAVEPVPEVIPAPERELVPA